MEKNSHISPKTKKILVGIGIGFGTVMTFLISFILAFVLIVNPINFMTVSDDDTLKENEELKSQVQTLEDEVEMLNTTVEKYKNSATSRPQTSDIPLVTTPSSTQQSKPSSNGSSQNHTQKPTEESSATSGNGGVESTGATQGNQGESSSGEESFAPETVTSTSETTPEDTEAPITVIDISE